MSDQTASEAPQTCERCGQLFIGECVCAAGMPDPLESRRLGSLWDMLNNYTWQFFLLSGFIESLHRTMGMPSSTNAITPPSSGPNAPNLLAGGLVPTMMSAGINGASYPSKPEQDDVINTLRLLESCCAKIGVLNVKAEIDRICRYVAYSPKSDMRIHIKGLADRITDELQDRRFLHVPPEREKYYRQPELFGPEIGKAIPKVAEDLSHAGTCYALGLNTACVFHLMRVMEHCVQRLGRKLRVSIDPTKESWHKIMLQVHKQIDQMPGGVKTSRAQTAKKQKFALAAGRLDHVRIVWRNDVMHPKGTYDEGEAMEVLNAIEAFLKSVADLL